MVKMKKLGVTAAVVAAAVCAHEAQADQSWYGRREVVEDVNDTVSFGRYDDTVVRQRGYTMNLGSNGDSTFAADGYSTVYLLEGGKLVKGGKGVYLQTGAYYQIRQTGGDISINRFEYLYPAKIRADFIFGGSGKADLGSTNYMELMGDAVIAFQDSVHFDTSLNDYKYVVAPPAYHRIWAYNGGLADYSLNANGVNMPNCPTNDFFAFNGGVRASRLGNYFAFGAKPDVRIYERGGEFLLRGNDKWNIDTYNFCEPEGGVIQSITLTPAAMSNIVDGVAQFWDYPPAVEIYDENGVGTNAAAVVDYDYDTRTITNITVVCGGEKFTASRAKAQFQKYDRAAAAVTNLLETPLVCEVVTGVRGGDFTFSATNLGAKVWILSHTNYMHGTLIIDMDRLGLADGGKNTSDDNNSVVIKYKGTNQPRPCFPNCTSIRVNSGALLIWSGYGYNHDYAFQNCYNLELYGGHFGSGTAAFTNVVVGGTVYLKGHNLSRGWALSGDTSPYCADLNITRTPGPNIWRYIYSVPPLPGTMVVDVDSPKGPAVLKGGSTGITANDGDKSACIGGGSVRFGGTPSNPCTMTIKNYESLRRFPRRRVLLDISDPNLVVAGTNNVNAVTPPDVADLGRLRWSAIDRKLYWEPYRGMVLLFR